MTDLITYQNEEYARALQEDIAREIREEMQHVNDKDQEMLGAATQAVDDSECVKVEENSEDEFPMSPHTLREKRLAYFTFSRKCVHLTKKGKPCKNTADANSVCRVHKKKV